MSATAIVQIGQYLTEVKAKLGHGRFLDWIEREFAWTDRHARRFMMVHERFKTDNLSDLDIDVSALYLIAAPKTPEPLCDDLLRRAENGEPVTHQGVRAALQRFAETGELPEVNKSLTQMIEERKAMPGR